ncbi:MAG: ribonuclease P protein component [Gemmatimonadaceae bacterium]|nr:ribonuclease P protein component [Gemmatimonadaceae bacterium]
MSDAERRRFARAQRLTRGDELAQVRQEGKRVRTASIDVRAIASLGVSARVGFIVPRYKQSAVARNRLKRRLRDVVRLEWLPSLPAIDVVVRVIPPAYALSGAALRDEMRLAREKLARLTFTPRADTNVPPTT